MAINPQQVLDRLNGLEAENHRLAADLANSNLEIARLGALAAAPAAAPLGRTIKKEPDEFSGNDEDWADWKHKLLAFISMNDELLRAEMEIISRSEKNGALRHNLRGGT